MTIAVGALPRETLRVEYEAGDRFRIAVRQHTITVDQPVEDGGEDLAPTPTELFIASLASCVAFYVRRYLSRRGRAVDGLTVSSEVDFASRPHRVGGITLRVRLPYRLAEDEREALLGVASRCTVHNSLKQPPAVQIGLEE